MRGVWICVALLCHAGLAGGFWRVTNADGRWRAVDPSGRPTAILGVDHVQWRGMACQALGGRRLYHEHDLTNYASKADSGGTRRATSIRTRGSAGTRREIWDLGKRCVLARQWACFW